MEQAKAALRPHLDRGGVLSVEFQQNSSLGVMCMYFKVAVEEDSPVRPSMPALKARF